MEVINKLYSTVSSTVSQLSSVLPGNPVAKDFEVGEHIASAGPGTSSHFYYLLYMFTCLSTHAQTNGKRNISNRIVLEDFARCKKNNKTKCVDISIR